MKNILSILPPRLGGLDMLLPIYLELKLNSKVFIEVIVPNNELMKQIQRDNYINNQLWNTVDRISVIELNRNFKDLNGIFRLGKGFFGLICLVSRIVLYKKYPILMHGSNFNQKLIMLIKWLFKRKNGLTIAHFKLLAGSELLDEETGRLPPHLNAHNSSKVFTERNIVNELYGDYFAVFNIDNVKSWNEESRNKCIEIGYTKVYKSWTDKLKKDALHHRSNDKWYPDFQGKAPFSLIFLPSTVKNIFNDDELENWLMEIILSVSEQFPNNPIIIKPHPLQKMQTVKRVLSMLSDIKCIISFVHPGLLAAQAQFVISHHSTTIIDAMALNVPVIHHQFFTDHWLKRHPSGPTLLDYGQVKSDNMNCLKKELKSIGKNKNSYSNLIQNIRHRDDIENLFDKIKLNYDRHIYTMNKKV